MLIAQRRPLSGAPGWHPEQRKRPRILAPLVAGAVLIGFGQTVGQTVGQTAPATADGHAAGLDVAPSASPA